MGISAVALVITLTASFIAKANSPKPDQCPNGQKPSNCSTTVTTLCCSVGTTNYYFDL